MPISRYNERSIPSGGLTTTMVAVVTDVEREGRLVVGFGFSSFGRFGQSGLIGERFRPRLLAAAEADLLNRSGDNFDPLRVWDCLMRDEKPGGHGERSIAVGTLDMAVWDATAKGRSTGCCHSWSAAVAPLPHVSLATRREAIGIRQTT